MSKSSHIERIADWFRFVFHLIRAGRLAKDSNQTVADTSAILSLLTSTQKDQAEMRIRDSLDDLQRRSAQSVEEAWGRLLSDAAADKCEPKSRHIAKLDGSVQLYDLIDHEYLFPGDGAKPPTEYRNCSATLNDGTVHHWREPVFTPTPSFIDMTPTGPSWLHGEYGKHNLNQIESDFKRLEESIEACRRRGLLGPIIESA